MKKIDKDGLMLCELQAKTFEMSIDATEVSSEIFIRRFMNSQISKSIDSCEILQTNMHAKDILERIEEQYGKSNYGSKRYTKNRVILDWVYISLFFIYL